MQFPLQIVLELIISYPAGTPAIQIGPGAEIEMFDSSGNLVYNQTPNGSQWQNSTMTGMIEITPQGGPVTGFYPGIYFFNAATGQPYQNSAWIQSTPDFNNNAALGINGGPYFSPTFGLRVLRQRMFWPGQGSGPVQFTNFLGAIDINTQAFYGGQLVWDDNQVAIAYYNNSVRSNGITVDSGNTFADTPIQVGAWAAVSFGTGFSNSGSPRSNCQYRLCSDGFVHLRGAFNSSAAPADGTLAFAIPLSFQPPANKYVGGLCRLNGAAGALTPMLEVLVTGGQTEFLIYGAGTATSFAMDGMSYESNTYMA